MESYIDNILNIENGDGMEIEYIHQEYQEFFPRYIERIQKTFQIKFFTPKYNTVGKKIYYYHSTSLMLNLYDDRDYINDVNDAIRSSKEQFIIIRGSLQSIIPTNRINKNETEHGESIGHSILIIYDRKKNQFYIVDPNGAASLYKYYEIAKRKFFNNPIEIKEASILQKLESEISNHENEILGYCVAWSYLYAILFILSINKDIKEITNLIMKKCNNNPIKLRKLIRNFTYECSV